jgi:hypothetical protein
MGECVANWAHYGSLRSQGEQLHFCDESHDSHACERKTVREI